MARVEREVRPGRGGSNRIASLNVEGAMNNDGPPSLAPSKHFDHVDETPTSQVSFFLPFVYLSIVFSTS